MKLSGTEFLGLGQGHFFFEDIPGIGFQFVQYFPLSSPGGSQYKGIDHDFDGDVAAVGDPGDGEVGQDGFVYVFRRTGGNWSFAQALGPFNDLYAIGTSLVVRGGRILIAGPEGGFLIPPSFGGAGRIWCYEDVNGTFVPSAVQPFIDPEFPVGDGLFGLSMDASGDWLLVGQPGNNVNGASLYQWQGTHWAFHAELGPQGVGTNVGANTGVGYDVAIDGNLAVVSAYGEAVNGLIGAGAVYVFEHDGTQWTGPVRLTASDPQQLVLFGDALDVDAASGRVLVGASRWDQPPVFPDPDPIINMGSAYIFHRQGPLSWVFAEQLVPAPAAPSWRFGRDVQINHKWAVMGSSTGAAFLHQAPFNMASAVSASSSCNGDGGTQPGCTACPCGNDAPAGSLGGCRNAAGKSARLYGERSLSVAANDLRLKLEDGAPSTFALLGSGGMTATTPGCPLGTGVAPLAGTDGLRCLSGSAMRHGVRMTDAEGAATWDQVVAAGGFQAGQTRHFQIVYRDSAIGPCGQAQNTTNALSMTFWP